MTLPVLIDLTGRCTVAALVGAAVGYLTANLALWSLP
jgi:hypothetical protein